MADSLVRVALLAKAGDARNQLRNALSELGAELVAEGDPNEMDLQAVVSKQPKLVLVGLEPAIELGLERFDDLLSSNDVEVIYDDAEVTATLSGWDLNRWARHLAAKIVGGDDVLPPVPEDAVMLSEAELQPSPGAVPTPAEIMQNAKLEDYTADTMAMAADVPSSDFIGSLDNAALNQTAEIQITESYAEPVNESAIADFVAPVVESKTLEPSREEFEIDTADVEQAMQRIEFAEQETVSSSPLLDADDAIEQTASFEQAADFSSESFAIEEISLSSDEDFANLDAGAVQDDVIMLEPDTSLGSVDTEATDFAFEESSAPTDIAFDSNASVRFSNYEAQDDDTAVNTELDSDVAALAEQMATLEKDAPAQNVEDFNFSLPSVESAPAAPAAGESNVSSLAADKPKLDFSTLSLMDMNDPSLIVTNKPVAVEQEAPALKKFDINSLQLEQESATDADAVVMLLAGLGGPDAIRQFISNLDPSSKLLVLIQQRLEVGSYDRLATQFGKVGRLPVLLAQSGMGAEGGKCYVVPANMGLKNDNGLLSFVEGLDETASLAALPPTKTHVLVASGASTSLLDAVRQYRNRGVNVRVQTPAECFEGEAAQALAKDGVQSVNPREWPQEFARD